MSITLDTAIAVLAKDYKMYPYYGGSKILDKNGQESGRFLVPFRDEIAREHGFYRWWEAYNDLLRDPHLASVDQKRRMAVIIRPWKIVPASTRSQDKKVAHFVEKTLRAIGHSSATEKRDYVSARNLDGFDTVCFKLLNAYFYGFSVGNIVWTTKEELIKIPVKPTDKLRRGESVYVKRKGDYQEATVKKVTGEKVTIDLEFDDEVKTYTVPKERLFRDKVRKFVVPKEVRSRVQNRFGVRIKGDDEFELVMITLEQPMGESLGDNRNFITCFYREDDGNPLGFGVAPTVYHAVQFKRRLMQFALGYADRFGSPQGVGKYPENQPVLKDAILAFFKQIAQEGYGAFPRGVDLEWLNAGGQGNQIYAELIDYLDREISKSVLGETGTTDQQGSGGSRARDQVGNDVRLEVAAADAKLLADTLNTSLIPWLVYLNFGPNVASPRIEWDFPELAGKEDLGVKAGRDVMLMGAMQLKPSLEYIEKTYDLPLEAPKGSGSPEGGIGALFAGLDDAPEGQGVMEQGLPPEDGEQETPPTEDGAEEEDLGDIDAALDELDDDVTTTPSDGESDPESQTQKVSG